MFEECFAMIEIEALSVAPDAADEQGSVEPEFDNLSFVLASVLDEALNSDDSLFSVH